MNAMPAKPAAHAAAREAVGASMPTHDGPSTRAAAGVLGAILGAAFLLHLPALRQPHFEGDEIIFTFMAERLRSDPARYTLQGPLRGAAAQRFVADTWLPSVLAAAPADQHARLRAALGALDEAEVLYKPFQAGQKTYAYDPEVYDRPFFFHPPVFLIALAAMRAGLGALGGALLAVLTHLLTIVLTALLGRAWAGWRVGLIAAGLVAFEPVSWMCGSRVWIDGMLQLWLVGAFAVLLLVLRGGGGPGHFVLAGAVFGVACLTKIPAILAAPAVLLAMLLGPRRATWPQIGAYALGAALLVVPWLLLTKAQYGAFLPGAYPSNWLIENYPFVRVLAGRPWHFYLSGLLLVSPVFLYVLAALAAVRAQRWLLVPLVWAAGVTIALSVLGVRGQGFQLRYLAPAMPALCLLAATGIARVSWGWALGAVPLFAITAVASMAAVTQVDGPEPFPIALMWWLDRMGFDYQRVLAGMWAATR